MSICPDSGEKARQGGQEREEADAKQEWMGEVQVFKVSLECQSWIRDFSSVCGEQKGFVLMSVSFLSSLPLQVTLQRIFWGCYSPKQRAVFQGEWIL